MKYIFHLNNIITPLSISFKNSDLTDSPYSPYSFFILLFHLFIYFLIIKKDK
jgi:hypothetical protein